MQTLQDKIESLEKRIEEKGKNQSVLEGHRFANTQRSGKVKCYKCSEEGHIRRNCPKLKRERDSSTRRSEQPKEGNARRIRGKQRRKNRKSSKGNVGASNLCEEAGIFIDSEVNDLKTKLLIDTGASLTLLSKRIYDKLPDKPVLEESRQVITSASGSRLCQYGKADFVIKIGRSRETVKLMVADISVDGILGLDFLRACKGDINFEQSSLKLNNEECRFSWEGTLGCYRVTADKDVCLPPRSEVVIQAKVPGENTFGSADYLVEAEPKFLESGRALVGRTLVKGHNIVPVCLMNITESVQQIHGGTLIAKMTAVEEQNASAGEAENSAKGLRSDLRELFDMCKLNLSPAQFSKLERYSPGTARTLLSSSSAYAIVV
uniref:CCHC-type domain-containing protein n=1 Tax=Magallana gigas TaxID=29159 RepID=A0A8W8NMP2_MAGGI